MKYEHLSKEQQADIAEQVTAERTPVHAASLIPAWEADHAGHAALLTKATADGDEEAAKGHAVAMQQIEAAITAARTAAPAPAT